MAQMVEHETLNANSQYLKQKQQQKNSWESSSYFCSSNVITQFCLYRKTSPLGGLIWSRSHWQSLLPTVPLWCSSLQKCPVQTQAILWGITKESFLENTVHKVRALSLSFETLSYLHT
jgi:hypothetical protein